MNTLHQHTIEGEVLLQGTGLHTGNSVSLRMLPGEANSGIIFKRTDLVGQPTLAANAFYATQTERGTTLEHNGCKVSTVEHMLAALVGTGVDNAIIEMNAAEAPILDGSSMPFVKAIQAAGVQQQKVHREYLNLQKPITYKDDTKNVEMIALPYEGYKITTMIDFNSKTLGQQHAVMGSIAEFATDFASARTFCFFHELKYLAENNLIKGGDLNNAVVVVDKPVTDEELEELAKLLNKQKIAVQKGGVLNTSPMRYTNEPARHKLLDIVGDLALVGKPLKCHIIASRPGHKTNVEFAKLIKQQSL